MGLLYLYCFVNHCDISAVLPTVPLMSVSDGRTLAECCIEPCEPLTVGRKIFVEGMSLCELLLFTQLFSTARLHKSQAPGRRGD
jgi:hypothetical protein